MGKNAGASLGGLEGETMAGGGMGRSGEVFSSAAASQNGCRRTLADAEAKPQASLMPWRALRDRGREAIYARRSRAGTAS